ncbi:carbon-nitrogen hydrolase [Xylariaceae sp. FL1651]|nr:carbon-nitrogen hydrolase [Xylariaceae sp. FL1651]
MAHNLAQCVKLMGQAASAGAKILFLPEASDYIATSSQESLSLARPVSSSSFVTGLQAAAAKHSIAVHVGIHVPVTVKPISSSSSSSSGTTSSKSNPVMTAIPQSEETDSFNPSEKLQGDASSSSSSSSGTTTKLYNRTIYITPNGSILPSGSYNKLHLFDYANLRESASTQAGSSLIPPIPSPIGRLGSLICFDLRFPEPALRLAQPPPPAAAAAARKQNSSSSSSSSSESSSGGNDDVGPAQILLYPSAFTVPTGRAHWEVLLRARAIETQSWVIAAAQAGAHNNNNTNNNNTSPSSSSSGDQKQKQKPRVSYGHSMVVDPWGRVVLELKGVRPDWDADRDGADDAVEEGAVGELGVVDIDLGEWERVREKMPLIRRT